MKLNFDEYMRITKSPIDAMVFMAFAILSVHADSGGMSKEREERAKVEAKYVEERSKARAKNIEEVEKSWAKWDGLNS